jgi:hypothetical protein
MFKVDDFIHFPDSPETTETIIEEETPIEHREYSFERHILPFDNVTQGETHQDTNLISIPAIAPPKNIQKHRISLRREPKEYVFEKPKVDKSTKNIVKNYGNAIIAFAMSKLAVPYLESCAKTLNFDLVEFQTFASSKKDTISGIDTFRALLIPTEKDSEKMKIYKVLFKRLAEVFVKYFSVNWIFHSRIKYKDAHLRFRNKMLRRIRDPEHFTYLKGKTHLETSGDESHEI